MTNLSSYLQQTVADHEQTETKCASFLNSESQFLAERLMFR